MCYMHQSTIVKEIQVSNKLYHVSRKVLQYDQLQKKDMPPLTLPTIVCRIRKRIRSKNKISDKFMCLTVKSHANYLLPWQQGMVMGDEAGMPNDWLKCRQSMYLLETVLNSQHISTQYNVKD